MLKFVLLVAIILFTANNSAQTTSLNNNNNNNKKFMQQKYLIVSHDEIELVGNPQPNTNNNKNTSHDNDNNGERLKKEEFDAQVNYYKRLSKKISFIVSPILLIIGGIGNPLCIIILLRKRKPNPTIIYLCLLAVFDILVLYTGLLRQYLKEVINFDFRDLSSLSCKFHIFLTYTFMQISSFILVAVTVNRFTTTYNRTFFCKQKKLTNLNNRKEGSPSQVFIVFAIICVCVSLMNIHFLFYYELVEGDKESQFINDCTIDQILHSSYYNFRVNYYSQIHLYLFIFFPCFILFIMNILIIKKIMQLSNPRLREVRSNSITQSSETRKKERKKTTLSIMLVSVCLWFMILKTPASVYITFPVAEMKKTYFAFAYTVFMLTNYTNHAVNLILYILTSAAFRRDFAEFFRICRRQRLPQNGEQHENGHDEHLKLNNLGDEEED